MFKNSFLRVLIVLGIGISLVIYSQEVARYIVQAIGVLFILPGLVTVFSSFSKDDYSRSVSVLPIVSGGGSVLLGVVLLLFPELFINILLYLLAGLLLLGSSIQIYQLVKLSREGMKSGAVYYLFPITIFFVGIYILLYPMESAGVPFLFVGYAALLFGVMEILTLMRSSLYRHKVHKAEEQEAKNAEALKLETEKDVQEIPADGPQKESVEKM